MFRSVQFPAAIGDEVFECFKIVVNHSPLLETVDNLRADVRAATNRWRIAKHLGGLLDCDHHLSLASCGFLDRLGSQTRQGAGTDNRTGPGAKVFGAEFLTHDLLDVFVDMAVGDIDKLAVAVLILKNLLTWLLEQTSHNFGHPPIVELQLLSHPGLPREIEFHRAAFNLYVLSPQRRYAMTAIFARINLTSRPHKAGRENSKHAGQHLVSTKVGLPEMPADGRPQLRQGFREFDEALKLL